ncbi:MAG: hypothetical protein HQ515_24770 [Phycisphaeraceae bacterium]|nr:hypothetical protein [Phycisphaeraceae bacterium]
MAFLTVLIWVWSDLALVEPGDLTQIPVVLGNSSDPNLLVSFVDDADRFTDHIMIDTVSVKGPAVRVDQIKTLERNEDLKLRLVLEPEAWDLTEPMEAPKWPLVNFVRRSPAIRGLSIDDCFPRTAFISVVQLAKRSLEVQCVDEDDSPIPAQITPSSITMYVPEAWPEDILTAYVKLSTDALNRAQGEVPHEAIPFVNIRGRIKTAKQSVKVRLPEVVTPLKTQTIQNPKFCLVVDPFVQKDFVIRIPNEVEKTTKRIQFKGTDEAKAAFQAEPYHVELVVERKEGSQAGPRSQILQYRFPRAYVEKNEIKPDDSPLDKIDFELVPRDSATANGNTP